MDNRISLWLEFVNWLSQKTRISQNSQSPNESNLQETTEEQADKKNKGKKIKDARFS